MSASVFDHPWLSGLFAAPLIAPLWSEQAQLGHLVAFERAYTQALAAAGRISGAEAQDAVAHIDAWQADIAGLKGGMAGDGVVVPALVRQMTQGLARPGAIHSGATSQDVMDTALVLTLRDVAQVLAADLAALVEALDRLNARHGGARMMGRTRMQAALPIAAQTRINAWRNPLRAAQQDLAHVSARTFRLQLGGAVGDAAALGADAGAVAASLGRTLNLPVADACWHSDRSSLVLFSGWLMQVTGALGKMGQDICLMAQQGIEEIAISGGGGSSAMPHKQNPVKAELLVTLSRFTAGMTGLMGQALVHEQERSGAAWALEWMVLPQMTMAAGCATHTARELLGQITRIGGPAQNG